MLYTIGVMTAMLAVPLWQVCHVHVCHEQVVVEDVDFYRMLTCERLHHITSHVYLLTEGRALHTLASDAGVNFRQAASFICAPAYGNLHVA